MTTPTTATRLNAPIALAICVILGEVYDAAIGFSTYQDNQASPIPGAPSDATIYLLAASAPVGVLILLIAVATAGRSRAGANAALALAALRLLIVGVLAALMIFGLAFTGPGGSSTIVGLVAVADAVAGVLICASLARRTRLRLR